MFSYSYIFNLDFNHHIIRSMYTVYAYEIYISSYHGEVKLLHEVCNIFVTFFVDFTYEISYELRTLYAYIYI